MTTILLFLSTFLMTAICLGLFKAIAKKKGIIDTPNERSSHTVPTVRGGGVVFASVWAVMAALLVMADGSLMHSYLAVLIPGFAVATIGFLDDIRSRSALHRLCVQILASMTYLYLRPVPFLDLGILKIDDFWMVQAICTLLIVFFINAYNFIDGIDGIAASNGVLVLLFFAVVSFTHDPESSIWPLYLLFAMNLLGFLCWNWPKASIFMGDAGSGFLGFMLATCCLQPSSVTSSPLIWIFPAAPIVLDVSYTLLRRMLRGEKWYSPHRSHCYQILKNEMGWSTLSVLFGYILFSLLCSVSAFFFISQPTDLFMWLIGITCLAGVIHANIWSRRRQS